MDTWRDMSEVLNHAIVIQGAASVQNAVSAYYCVCLHDCASHDNGSRAKLGGGGDSGRRMYAYRVNVRYPPHFLLPCSIIAYSNNPAVSRSKH